MSVDSKQGPRIAIVGSRTFADYERVCEVMKAYPSPALIVSGGAQGADRLAERWAKEHNTPTRILKPDWAGMGKAAGFLRNTDIVAAADVVIAFWDGKSNGTRDTITKAQKANKTVIIHEF